jgi:hypothetical protein
MVRVAWVPGWYELDPMLEIGLGGEFAFWRNVPDHLSGREQLVLYNTLWHPEDALIANGTIVGITHPELGDIRKVDTRGLDYTIALADGGELLVNAEEEPGRMYERGKDGWIAAKRVISDWRFVVEFESLSEQRPASP